MKILNLIPLFLCRFLLLADGVTSGRGTITSPSSVVIDKLEVSFIFTTIELGLNYFSSIFHSNSKIKFPSFEVSSHQMKISQLEYLILVILAFLLTREGQ